MTNMKALHFVLISLTLVSCVHATDTTNQSVTNDTIEVVSEPIAFPTHVGEIQVPQNYERVFVEDTTSFAYYLRHLSLKPEGTPVYSYNGEIMWTSDHAYAVIDSIDTGKDNLQQCADAIIRLRAEWLYKHKRYDEITFHFTNGWLCDYKHWAEGNRVAVNGNRTSWYHAVSRDYSYPTFRKYLDMVFNYAGTLSLSRELKPVELQEMQIGDVFILGGSPGHAIIIVDVAENPDTHDKAFVVAESYMPAQDIHILKNSNGNDLPWFFVNDFLEMQGCSFPTYWYSTDCLKRFP